MTTSPALPVHYLFITKILGTHITTKRKTVAGKRLWVWQLSNLEACRLDFNRATHSQHPWPAANDEDV